MKRFLGLLLLCQAAWAAQPGNTVSDPFPEVATSYLVEVDGETVWAKDAQRRLPPASLTKLMTALLVIEQGQLQSVAGVTPAATHETGSRIGIRSGEKFHVEDLLAATLIASANDACHALADFVAGSESAFVLQMNRRAEQLGMRDTHFSNACGHDADGHYSSTYDLSLLAHQLLRHSEVTGLTARAGARIHTMDGKRNISFNSRNALIGRYRGALGLKTGYTPNAGKCLVAYAERGDDKVLLVMLHGNDRWWDAVDILDLAFDHARL